MKRTVTLVDEAGNVLGEADLLAAHTNGGQLHRAFSVYVFRNDRSEMLIQRRSSEKMLWPMIWANTCCSHPFADETAVQAGQRRLHEELGFTCDLQPHSDFVYRADDPTGRGTEHEYVTILVGDCDDAVIKADPKEVAEWKWMPVADVFADFEHNPDLYSPWFKQGLLRIFPTQR